MIRPRAPDVKTTATGGVPVPTARRGMAFSAICLAYFAILLDGSVLNVAVPAIRHGLGSSMAGAQWVLNGYTLALASLLLTAGSLGDRLGLRRILLGGMLLFTVASAACAAAPGIGALVAARVVQGVGAASLLPATLAVIPHLYPEAARRARATLCWVAVGAVSVAVGPLAGGLLIDAFGWRSIFLINLPIGAVSAGLTWATMPETERHGTKIDHRGQLTAAASLGLLTAGLILTGATGWGSPATVGVMTAGVLAAAGFWITEKRGSHPMLPPSFFADRGRAVAVVSAAMMGFVFYGTLFVSSLYFQELRGWSPGSAGVALLPLTAASTAGPFVFYPRLSRRVGDTATLTAGFCCCALGTATLGWLGPHSPYPLALAGLVLTGGASTISFSALTSLLLSRVPAARSGLGSGVQNTARQSGALVAVAILGSVLSTSAFAARLPVAFCIIGMAAAAGILAGIVGMRSTTESVKGI